MSDTTQTQVRRLLSRQQSLNQRQHKRLARKIHDEISQKMTLLALQLSLAATQDGAPTNWDKYCKEWADLVLELGQSIREITNELQPRIQDESGLTSAFHWLAQATAKTIPCKFVEPNRRVFVPPFAANELFAICREIISDILVPAKVAQIEIQLKQDDETVQVQLLADETGTEKEVLTEAALEALALGERLVCIDGVAELKRSPDSGSVLTLSVPTGKMAACAAR